MFEKKGRAFAPADKLSIWQHQVGRRDSGVGKGARTPSWHRLAASRHGCRDWPRMVLCRRHRYPPARPRLLVGLAFPFLLLAVGALVLRLAQARFTIMKKFLSIICASGRTLVSICGDCCSSVA